MALPSHHVAFVSLNNKIYAFGGFVLPPSGPAGWMPLDNAWQYDPSIDSWAALAPMPSRPGAAAAAAVEGKIYVVGGWIASKSSSRGGRRHMFPFPSAHHPHAGPWLAGMASSSRLD
jgi:hypothetical protein